MEKPSLDKAKAGAIRYNTDISQLEIYDGNQWTGILGTSPEQQTGGTRGFWIGGEGFTSVISFANIDTTGNAGDFGDLANGNIANGGTAATRVRGVYAGGEPSTSTCSFITLASQGNSVHNGEDLSSGRRFVTAVSDKDRGIFMGGSEPSRVNKIEYMSISASSSAIDFGDLQESKDMGGGGGWSNGVIGGGFDKNDLIYFDSFCKNYFK